MFALWCSVDVSLQARQGRRFWGPWALVHRGRGGEGTRTSRKRVSDSAEVSGMEQFRTKWQGRLGGRV